MRPRLRQVSRGGGYGYVFDGYDAPEDASADHAEELRHELEVERGIRYVAEQKLKLLRPLLGQGLLTKLIEMTADERAIAEAFVDKMMGEGRAEYGPYCSDSDQRTVSDLAAQMFDEMLDATWYSLARRHREGGQ